MTTTKQPHRQKPKAQMSADLASRSARDGLAERLTSILGYRAIWITKNRFEIQVPWPSAKLHSHNKGNWRAKSAEVRRVRQMSKTAAGMAIDIVVNQQAGAILWTPIFPAILTIDFYAPDNRRRDVLNLCHSLKPVIDGVVDAGLIHDDSWQTLSIGAPSYQVASGPPGYVVLRFTRR
jgi:crossover junction endodeoxyribonuclease RusA